MTLQSTDKGYVSFHSSLVLAGQPFDGALSFRLLSSLVISWCALGVRFLLRPLFEGCCAGRTSWIAANNVGYRRPSNSHNYFLFIQRAVASEARWRLTNPQSGRIDSNHFAQG